MAHSGWRWQDINSVVAFCCKLAAFRLLFAHLCNHSAAEGVKLTRDLPDGLTEGRHGEFPMSISTGLVPHCPGSCISSASINYMTNIWVLRATLLYKHWRGLWRVIISYRTRHEKADDGIPTCPKSAGKEASQVPCAYKRSVWQRSAAWISSRASFGPIYAGKMIDSRLNGQFDSLATRAMVVMVFATFAV
jgi:hypothetical protein